jgi:glycosyltransferase involved in cell wall biosynthesis
VPNGLQPDDFEHASADPQAADILFIGELRAIKGVNVLLAAIAALNAERAVPVRAVIVGSGPEADKFKDLARDLGLQNDVSFPGALVARHAFGLGRVMVVPSLAESFPYVVLEAAAAGLPLVSTNVGGIPEIVAGTDTVLIEPGNVTQLSAALNTVFADPAAARARAERLRDNVAAKFTVAGMTSAVLDFYGAARR